jgi:hypothetical protein
MSAALALLGAAFMPCLVHAQSDEPVPLFAASDIVELTLAVPVRTLVTRRKQRPKVEGTISYNEPDGTPVTLDVEVRTRGRSRLEICSFPPLRLNLRRSQLEGTLFAQQNKLKLVTLCRSSNNYEQYLRLEYLVYRIYEQVSDYAFKVRPVIVHYVDTDRDGRTNDAPAFLIESIDGLAERVGMTVASLPSVAVDELEPAASAVLGVFQYMIGNTDWSSTSAPENDDCCHNIEILGEAAGAAPYVPVPYDFDMSGFINTVYALPPENLPLRSVRQRLYRGLCADNDELDETFARFDAARPAIERLLRDATLEERYRESAMRYVTEFYEVIDAPEERQKEIVDACRGRA